MAVRSEAMTGGRVSGGTKLRRAVSAAGLGLVMAVAGSSAQSQQPAPGTSWDTGTRIDRTAPEKQPRVPSGPPANTTVIPRAPGDVKADAQTSESKLEAFLTA